MDKLYTWAVVPLEMNNVDDIIQDIVQYGGTFPSISEADKAVKDYTKEDEKYKILAITIEDLK